MSGHRHVAVAGAGIVGLCVAHYLLRDGWRVTLLDRAEPGSGCSSGNAGVLAADSIVPLGSPRTLAHAPAMLFSRQAPLAIRWRYLPRLLPWLARFAAASLPARMERSAAAQSRLMSGALDAWREVARAVDARSLIRERGWLHAYATESAFQAGRAEREMKRRYGVHFDELCGNEARQLVPALGDGVRRAVRYPAAAHSVDPEGLAQCIAADVVGRGGEIRRAEVLDLEVTPRCPARLHTSAGPLDTDLVVVALGAWSAPLARRLGHRVPLDTERGYHVMAADAGIEMPLPVMLSEIKMVATSMSGGLRIAGSVEFAGTGAPADERRATRMAEGARRYLRGLPASWSSTWMGCRPSLPDSLPVLGRSPATDSVLFAFGHHHLGLTQAAVSGRIIGALAGGRDPGLDMAPYRVDRFA